MANKLYKEEQHFNGFILIVLLSAGSLWALFKSSEYIWADASAADSITCLSISLLLGMVVWWLVQLRMKVVVNDKRIKFKMTPFHKKPKKIDWEEVESCKIIKTPEVAQWHGANVHFGGESWFSLVGRNGMSVKTKSGQKYFIGCKNVDKLTSALKKL